MASATPAPAGGQLPPVPPRGGLGGSSPRANTDITGNGALPGLSRRRILLIIGALMLGMLPVSYTHLTLPTIYSV